jgi:hypothetical protein
MQLYWRLENYDHMLGNKGEEFMDAEGRICMNCFQGEFLKTNSVLNKRSGKLTLNNSQILAMIIFDKIPDGNCVTKRNEHFSCSH